MVSLERLSARVENCYTVLTLEKGRPRVAPGRKEGSPKHAHKNSWKVNLHSQQSAHHHSVEIFQLLPRGDGIKSTQTAHKVHHNLRISPLQPQLS